MAIFNLSETLRERRCLNCRQVLDSIKQGAAWRCPDCDLIFMEKTFQMFAPDED